MESLLGALAREQHQGEKMEWQLGRIAHSQRNLFGPVDHEQLRWDFQHMLCSNIEGAKQKWNFDFLQDVPMEGFLQWEELGGHEVPTFYHSCVVRESRRPLRHLNRPLCREEKAHRLTLTALAEKPKASKQTGAGKVPEGKKRRQMSLTDYYSGKKRMRTNTQAAAKKPTA
ncbi:cyclin-dependent kinase inhibitor 1-like isoform X1 [Lagopus leucura]|uniref:cyclin-dependent kinase inhibitor 1-like isoform X1 n=2 Tax=Lagopus leucura TaxID=30410 RepID=UPI001C66571F|nr:cyclin-dependent kinase inhibitor 1-like isoform X1 [Lagopus leucura]